MGKTADIMTHKQALKMRLAIESIINLTDPDRYCVAITERLPMYKETETDYEIHLYVRNPKKSGYLTLALLAHAIEEMGTQYLATESTYDAGTLKDSDNRESIKIW